MPADLEVHRVYRTVTQKVGPVPGSLHPDAAYIVMDNRRKDLGVWVGGRCSNVDRRIAENLGSTIKYNTYKKATASTHIIVTVEPAAPDPFFLSALAVSAEQFSAARRPKTLSNDTIKLYDVIVDASGTTACVKLNSSKTPQEGGNCKLDFTGFDTNKAFFVECGAHEFYLWVGGRVPFKHQKLIKDLISGMRSNYEYVHQNMEPLLLKNKFLNVKEAFDSSSPVSCNHSSPVSRAISLPAIGPEVARMVDENMGTLKMVSRTSGQLGDCLRQGLLIDFANDESGVLSIYEVIVHGSVRSLEECYPSSSAGKQPVVFFQSGAYAVLYICKNGARGLVYLWVGDSCPPDVQVNSFKSHFNGRFVFILYGIGCPRFEMQRNHSCR